MSANFYSDLGWLPRPAPDFRARLKSWPAEKNVGETLRFLATQALSLDQLSSLARQIGKARDAGVNFDQFTPYTLGIVSNATIDHIAPALLATGLRHGLLLNIVTAPYGQIMQAATGALSEFSDQSFDSVLCALDARGFPENPGLFNEHKGTAAATDSIAYLQQVSEGISGQTNAPCILQTVAPAPETAFGSLTRRVAGTNRHYADEFNRQLATIIGNSNDLLLDVAAIAETIGTANWHDPQLYALAKMPFAQDFVPLYAEHVCRLMAAHKGKSKRCLVLDLDNTLWGGVIGDDGVSGIRLGQGDPVGEAYLAVQETALQLRQRGVVLAVSSKNEDALAREPFQQHPDMILKEEHIAVFRANWDNKADNITAIAQELSLGLDTFVFIDDNPAERALVREQLPEVAVPELPEEPALCARALLAGGYFESIHFSAEDRQRADDYQAQAKRSLVLKSSVDMDAFLASLKMEAVINPFQHDSLKRVAQLVGKSNQFNLTTKRYSENDIAAMAESPDFRTWQVRLADSFGDNGLIGVVICAVHDDHWEIDTWLMSCRILGRRVEELLLREIIADARAEGITALRAMYIPTKRNMMVANHYPSLGFSRLELKAEPGTTCWQLDLGNYQAPELPFLLSRT